jgi:pimeloyl-ACP methyl ester carboxylesterase
MAAVSPFAEPPRQEFARCWLPAPYRQELVYRVAGKGQPVVFLHGLWNSSAVWKRAIDLFSPHYWLHAPDLPGHGQSPARLPWRLREVKDMLAAWMRSLKLSSATFVGHSMGGALAIMLAATEPQLVERLVLVNSVGVPMQFPFLGKLMHAGQGLANHQNLRYASHYGSQRYLQSLAIWQATDEVLACDLRAELPLVRCPTLIIWGMHDPLLPVQSAVALQRSIQGAELVMLPNARHHPSRQVPATFDAILEDFLGRQDASDQAAR